MLTAERVETLLAPVRQQWIAEGYDFEWRTEVTTDEFGNPYVYVDLLTDRQMTVAEHRYIHDIVEEKLIKSPEMEGYWQHVSILRLAVNVE